MYITQEMRLSRLLNGADKEMSIKWALEYCKEERLDKIEVVEKIDKSIKTRQINIKMYRDDRWRSAEFNSERIKKEEEMIKRYQEFITRLFDVKKDNKIENQVKEEKTINPNAFIVYGD